MKKTIAFLFLLIAINATAQTDAEEDTTAKPAITAIGKPDGKLMELKIGKDGGSLSSSDEKITLIIPEGAVSKKTNFSIQPITNTMPNGNGLAYPLQPSAAAFQKPIQLIFNYDEEEAKDTMQLLMGIAMQDDKGQWFSLKNSLIDTVAKTLSGNINHFSDWSKFAAIKLDPDNARVKVKKTLSLFIIGVVPKPKDDDRDLSPLYKTKEPKKLIWKVNNAVGGNTTFGTIKGWVGSTDKILEYGRFTAPDIVPDSQNPVVVAVKLQGLSIKFNGSNFNNLNLVSNILIYDDAYEIKMISSTDGFAGSLGKVTYQDTGSFVISLKKNEGKIIEKVNKNASALLNYSGGDCNAKLLKQGTGNIHISGTPVIKVTPSSSPEKGAWIEINFKRYPVMFLLLQFTCPKLTNTNAQGNAMLSALAPAFPIQIKFEAKEGEQTIMEFGTPGIEVYAKFTVKQLKEE